MNAADIVNYFFITIQALIQPFLLCILLTRKPKFLLGILFAIMNFAAYALPMPLLLGIGCSTASLVMFCRFALSENPCGSILYGLLSSEIMWLCVGLSNSVITLASGLIGSFPLSTDGVICIIICNVISLMAYWLIINSANRIIDKERVELRGFLIVLIPLLMIFIVEIYIVKSLYSAVNTDFKLKNDIEILLVQIIGTASIFCILFAYKKCAEAFAEHERERIYENEYSYRQQYATEIKSYYDKARSLRHDFKNHIMIVGELLRKKQFDQAANYISELEVSAESSAPLFHTGCMILDIIFSAKLSDYAEFVKIEIGAVPEIDETDICTIFANALDNAVCAISKLSDKRFISVRTKKRGSVLLIEIENSFDGKPFVPDIGIGNIIRTAEKYNGTAKIITQGNIFSLKIILCNSHH